MAAGALSFAVLPAEAAQAIIAFGVSVTAVGLRLALKNIDDPL